MWRGSAHLRVFDDGPRGARFGTGVGQGWPLDVLPRKRDPKTGKVPPVGNTVDVATATYTNSIGAVELKGQWTDPDFDPKVSAIYYARVLEIPTPRWPTYLAVRNNLPIPDNTPPSFQERAWTSPVFYKGTSVDGS